MFRYATIGLTVFVATSAFAQPNEASVPASTEATAVVPMEYPQPGDFWTYEVRDDITGKVTAVRTNVITEVTADDISVRFTAKGGNSEGLNVYDRSWNVKSWGSWKHQPHDGTGIHSPLKLGLSWNFGGAEVNAGNGYIWKRSGHSKVVAHEAVTTRAGSFDTFKVETAYTRHATNDPTGKSDVLWETWYAPAIDHWVALLRFEPTAICGSATRSNSSNTDARTEAAKPRASHGEFRPVGVFRDCASLVQVYVT